HRVSQVAPHATGEAFSASVFFRLKAKGDGPETLALRDRRTGPRRITTSRTSPGGARLTEVVRLSGGRSEGLHSFWAIDPLPRRCASSAGPSPAGRPTIASKA